MQRRRERPSLSGGNGSVCFQSKILLRLGERIREGADGVGNVREVACDNRSGLKAEGGVGPTQHELAADDMVVKRNGLREQGRVLNRRVVCTQDAPSSRHKYVA